jgi:multiple antibiotic resistance protein
LERASFIFTILFLLLGPIKIISAFHRLMHQADPSFKREVAVKASLIASALVGIVGLFGDSLATRYRISLDSLRIAGGLVLLISALKIMFPSAESSSSESSKPTALQLAISPVGMPIIVPPAGVAAIMIFAMQAPKFPGAGLVIALALATMIALDFLVMFFVDQVVRLPGLLLLLRVFGYALIFIQLALAIEVLVSAFRSLGVPV